MRIILPLIVIAQPLYAFDPLPAPFDIHLLIQNDLFSHARTINMDDGRTAGISLDIKHGNWNFGLSYFAITDRYISAFRTDELSVGANYEFAHSQLFPDPIRSISTVGIDLLICGDIGGEHFQNIIHRSTNDQTLSLNYHPNLVAPRFRLGTRMELSVAESNRSAFLASLGFDSSWTPGVRFSASVEAGADVKIAGGELELNLGYRHNRGLNGQEAIISEAEKSSGLFVSDAVRVGVFRLERIFYPQGLRYGEGTIGFSFGSADSVPFVRRFITLDSGLFANGRFEFFTRWGIRHMTLPISLNLMDQYKSASIGDLPELKSARTSSHAMAAEAEFSPSFRAGALGSIDPYLSVGAGFHRILYLTDNGETQYYENFSPFFSFETGVRWFAFTAGNAQYGLLFGFRLNMPLADRSRIPSAIYELHGKIHASLSIGITVAESG